MEDIIPKGPNSAPLWAWFNVFEIDAAFYSSQWNQVTSGITNMKKTLPNLSLVCFGIKILYLLLLVTIAFIVEFSFVIQLQSTLFKARFDLMFAIAYLQKDDLLVSFFLFHFNHFKVKLKYTPYSYIRIYGRQVYSSVEYLVLKADIMNCFRIAE